MQWPLAEHPRLATESIPVKTPGDIEAPITGAITRFEQNYMGGDGNCSCWCPAPSGFTCQATWPWQVQPEEHNLFSGGLLSMISPVPDTFK
jgi:hypothetical protein